MKTVYLVRRPKRPSLFAPMVTLAGFESRTEAAKLVQHHDIVVEALVFESFEEFKALLPQVARTGELGMLTPSRSEALLGIKKEEAVTTE